MRYLVLAILLCVTSPALARPAAPECQPTGDVMRPCAVPGASLAPKTPTQGDPVVRQGRQQRPMAAQTALTSHPAGCPARAFCGCGAAVRVFGHPVRELFLASNWFKFPRASPASGMVAVRHGHVFVLEEHAQGNEWLVYDANSGGHQTRIHHRSIAGYTIVNPRA